MVGTSWVMTGVEYDEYVSLLSGLCASDLKGATQRCRIFYFILIITVEKKNRQGESSSQRQTVVVLDATL